MRRRCVGEGIEAALGRKQQVNRRPKWLDGQGEAHLIALVCGEPPEGRAGWTLKLLADRLVECEIVESISTETVRQTLKKTNSSPRSATGQALAERVLVHPAARQRRVRLCDGRRTGSLSAPVRGQRSSGLPGRDQQATEPALGHDRGVKETRLPRPARPGAAGSYDYEYERNGVSNLFMLFAPLEGWRRVEVTVRRTKADWARVVKQLVDEDYPHKDRIVLVMDNLNTHHPSSLYEAFEPCRSAAHRRTVG